MKTPPPLSKHVGLDQYVAHHAASQIWVLRDDRAKSEPPSPINNGAAQPPHAPTWSRDSVLASRFTGAKHADVLLSQPGTYTFYAGIRRDASYFQRVTHAHHAWLRWSSGRSANRPASSAENSPEQSEDEASSSGATAPTAHSTSATSTFTAAADDGFKRAFKAARAGGRRALETLTAGKVGRLAVDIDLALVDASGNPILPSEQIELNLSSAAGSRTMIDRTIVVSPSQRLPAALKLTFTCSSTFHLIEIFAGVSHVNEAGSRFPSVEDVAGTDRILPTLDAANEAVNELLSAGSEATASDEAGADHESNESLMPSGLLQRAVLGSANPKHSALARSLAWTCMVCVLGVTLGLSPHTKVSPDVLWAAISWACAAWLARVALLSCRVVWIRLSAPEDAKDAE